VPSFHVAALRDSFGAEAVGGHTKLASSEPKGVGETLQMYNAIIKAPARRKDAELVKIDNAWVERQKEATKAECAAAGVPFLSTNDLIVAHYFSSTGATHGTIACDCRGRSPDVPAANKEFKPGNYISSVFVTGEEFKPTIVRNKVATTLKNASKPAAREAPPAVATPKLGNLTNWSSAYVHLNLPGCTNLIHFPIVNSERDVTHCNLYIFRPRPGELGALNFFKPSDEAPTDSPFVPLV